MYAVVRYSGSARTVVAAGFERDDALRRAERLNEMMAGFGVVYVAERREP